MTELGIGQKGRVVRRASRVVAAGAWRLAEAVDHVVLDAEQRYRRRVALAGEGGTHFLLDLPHALALRAGDGLVLDDEHIVAVIAKPEPLVEVTAADANTLARLAWHLGNRHAEVEVIGGRLRLGRDHVLEDMLLNLGASIAFIEAPFEPERGAYGHAHPVTGDFHV